MGLGQPVYVVCEEFDYLEFLETAAASQAFKALYRHLATPCNELNKLGSLAVVELLQDFKQPLHYWGLCGIVLIDSVLFEIHDYK